MNASQYVIAIRILLRIFKKFSPYFIYLRRSQITKMDAIAVLFIEFSDL